MQLCRRRLPVLHRVAPRPRRAPVLGPAATSSAASHTDVTDKTPRHADIYSADTGQPPAGRHGPGATDRAPQRRGRPIASQHQGHGGQSRVRSAHRAATPKAPLTARRGPNTERAGGPGSSLRSIAMAPAGGPGPCNSLACWPVRCSGLYHPRALPHSPVVCRLRRISRTALPASLLNPSGVMTILWQAISRWSSWYPCHLPSSCRFGGS